MIQRPAQARGILLIVVTMFFFALMDVCAKFLAERAGVLQMVWARYAGQTLIVLAILAPRLRTVARTDRLGFQILRSLFLLVATCFFFTALSLIPIASATAVMNLNPVLITLGAALFLGETIGPRRLIGVGLAFTGALIIIRPGGETFTPAALLPLGGAVCYAAYALTTRYVGSSESMWTTLLYTALTGAILLSLVVPFYWTPPDATALALMVAIGAFGTAGQICLIRAYMVAEAGAIAPYAYSGVIFAVINGILFFGEYPDPASYLGMVVIVAAGLYVWHRDRADRRAAAGQNG